MTEDVSPTTLSGYRWANNPSSSLLFDNSTILNGTEEELDGCDPRNVLSFNCSLENYLTFTMGPKRLPLEEAIPFTVAYLVIFVTGVVGNAAVCVVIVRHPSMRTATNYYLFSLACSDLMLLLFGLPNDLSCYWHQYPYVMGTAFCKFRALISEASSYVSVLTIVAFSMERYLAICHPLHLYAMSGLQRAVRIIAALWLVSMAAAMPFAVFTTVHYLDYPPQSNRTSAESAFCAMLGQPAEMPLWELSSIIFFILPALIMIFLYSRMGLRIRSRHGRRRNTLKGVNGSVHGEARQAQSRKAIIRMLAAVVIAFFLCWAPFHAQRLLYLYGRHLVHYKDINQWLFSVAGLLYYVSATVNPILYNVMSNRYRVAFQETLCCGRRRGAATFTRDHSFHETVVSEAGLLRARTARRRALHQYGADKPQTTLVLNKNYANNKLICKGNGCTKNKVIFSMKHNGRKEHRNESETIGNTNRMLSYDTDLDTNYIDLESEIIKSSSDKSNISIEIYVPMKGDNGEKQLLADDGNEHDAHQDLVIVLGNSAGKNVKKVYAGMCCKPINEDTMTSLKTSTTFIETCI